MGNNNKLQKNHSAHDAVVGLILLGIAILIFLALVTYDPKAIPSWMPLISWQDGAMRASGNWAGILGAIVAGYLFFFFGAAAFLWVIVAGGFGFAKLALPNFLLSKRVLWSILMVVCGAAILQLLPYSFLADWTRESLKIEGAGGFIGKWIGKIFGRQFLGPVGAPLVLFTLYIVSLIFAIGLHPIQIVREIMAAIRRRREDAKNKRIEGMTEFERIAAEQITLQKEQEKLERRAAKEAKKAAKIANQTGDETPAENGECGEGSEEGEPRIIDANAPIARPSIEELNARRKKQQADGKNKTISHLDALDFENYELPPLSLLAEIDDSARVRASDDELKSIQRTIIDTLSEFQIETTPGDITYGPTITRYEVRPVRGVRVDKIANLERDIARATRAHRINILAPIPGKDTVGIELANASKVKVTLRELIDTEAWVNTTAKLPLALGKDVYGKTIIGDLAKMPHCLVAGTTGSGKSVCINSIVASLVFRFTPKELRFIMIDPKVVELQIYNKLPHLITPVVTDPKKVLMALKWLVDEMEMRYKIFAAAGVRNIESFHSWLLEQEKKRAATDALAKLEAADAELSEAAKSADPDTLENAEDDTTTDGDDSDENVAAVRNARDGEVIIPDEMSYIVMIVDELADLMQTAPAEVEGSIARITQMARAAGIHVIIATQTPRANVITGVIKANVPTRIAFQVASGLDSRVILETNGAENLLGQGDMMYVPPGSATPTRAQGVYVADDEIKRMVEFVSNQAQPNFEASIHDKLQNTDEPEEDITEEEEVLLDECLDIMHRESRASTSLFQRRLRLGYARAARIVDIMEKRGIVGPKKGSNDREILVKLE